MGRESKNIPAPRGGIFRPLGAGQRGVFVRQGVGSADDKTQLARSSSPRSAPAMECKRQAARYSRTISNKVFIYTDGGARGNPGPAGIGAVITNERGNVLKEISKSLGVRTNNWAEYEAIIEGLQAVKKIFGKEKLKAIHIEVRADSELVVKQLQGLYQVKEETLFPQFIKIWNMRVADLPNIAFFHIPREKNKEADALANKAMDDGIRDEVAKSRTLF